jgi:hypothetical protein
MCLLIVKPAGINVPESELFQAAQTNPHGAGVAWHDGKQNRILKNANWQADDVCDQLANLRDYPAIIHFRYATHGSISDSNAHPFQLPLGWVAAHNGVISGLECLPDESDTRAFLRQTVAPIIESGEHIIKHIGRIEDLVGDYNKLAFLAPNGELTIANEDSGEWEGGVWYSNFNHRRSPERDTYKGSSFDWLDIRDAKKLNCDYCAKRITGEFSVSVESGIVLFACDVCSDLTFP